MPVREPHRNDESPRVIVVDAVLDARRARAASIAALASEDMTGGGAGGGAVIDGRCLLTV